MSRTRTSQEVIAGEEWRVVQIAEFAELFEVSDQGRVRSMKTGRIIGKAGRGASARRLVAVTRLSTGRPTTVTIMELVARAFLPPRPTEHHHPGPLNGDVLDTRVANVAWTTKGKALSRFVTASAGIERPCTHCGGPRANPKHGWCAPCRTQNYYAWRKANPEADRKAQRESYARRRDGTSRRIVRSGD